MLEGKHNLDSNSFQREFVRDCQNSSMDLYSSNSRYLCAAKLFTIKRKTHDGSEDSNQAPAL